MVRRPLIPVFMALAAGILVAEKALQPCRNLFLSLFLLSVFLFSALLLRSSRLKFYCLLFVFFFSGVFLLPRDCGTPGLRSHASQRKQTVIEGTLVATVKEAEKLARLKVRAHTTSIDGKCAPANEDLYVSVYNHPPRLSPGEKVLFPARLRPFKNFNNPGRYDYESAMRLKGLSCAASISDGRNIVPMGPGHMPFPRGLFERVQGPIREFFRKELSATDCALFRALILGERQAISHELREPFNETGLGHVLAVSGLHIGLVASVAFVLFRMIFGWSYWLTLKVDIRKSAALLTCFPVAGYAFLAGFQVSSQRAMIMALCFLWSFILGREREVWSTLALAGLLILAVDPLAIFSISFQLSFAAVIGILWLTPVILNKISTPVEIQRKAGVILGRSFDYFAGLIAVTLSATIFVLPLTCLYFHQISLVAIPANLTVVPILGLWVIPLGLLSTLVLPFLPQAAGHLLTISAWGLHGMMEIARFWSRLPWSSLWVVTPNLFEISMYYTLILFLFFYKQRQWARKGMLVLALFILADVGYWVQRVHFNRDLRVTFLDVGQGNSALVEFPRGKKMLIDGGGFAGDHFDVGKMVVAPFLWHSKIQNIHYLVLSHPQSDHMNGLRFIAKVFNPGEFWYNGDEVRNASFKELMAITDSKKIRKVLPADLLNGRQINGVRVEVLHPVPIPGGGGLGPFHGKAGLNNNSLVLKISYQGRSFLFPGDLEHQGEEVLVSNFGLALKSDVLLSPHHGSQTSSSMEFLEAVQPRICVISSGDGNLFGFPHQQTLRRLQDMDCDTITISRTGAVQFTVTPNRFEATSFLGGILFEEFL